MLGRNRAADEGAGIVEYGGVILLVSAIVGAVMLVGVPERVADLYRTGVCRITDPQECEEPGGPQSVSGVPDDQDPTVVPLGDYTPPSPEDRVPEDDTAWPYQVVPASDPGRGDDEAADPEDEDEGEEDLATSGNVPADESPAYNPSEEYVQMEDVRESEADFQSVGDGKPLWCGLGPDNSMEHEYTGESVCETLIGVKNAIDGARIACANPRYWFSDEQWAYCRPNAADYFEHYLGATGEDMIVDMDEFLSDVPEFEEEIERKQNEVIEDVLADAQERGIDGPLTYPIHTQQVGWGYPPDAINGGDFVYENPDWANAIGSFHYWLEGEITVYPPEEPGGEPTYSMDTSINMEKWYSWERGDESTLEDDNPANDDKAFDPLFEADEDSGIIDQLKADSMGFSHSDLALLHQHGAAQEFWVRGDKDLPTVEG